MRRVIGAGPYQVILPSSMRGCRNAQRVAKSYNLYTIFVVNLNVTIDERDSIIQPLQSAL